MQSGLKNYLSSAITGRASSSSSSSSGKIYPVLRQESDDKVTVVIDFETYEEVKSLIEEKLIQAVIHRERIRRDTEDWYASTAALRKVTSLIETLACFGYTTKDIIEHRELEMMFRAVEKAMEFEIRRLTDSDVIGSQAHADAKALRAILTSIRAQFDSTYSLTAALCVLPRNISKISTEKFFRYDFVKGKVTG